MVEIECLACKEPIKLPQYINTEDYDGQVVCQECQSLLYIKLVKSKVRKYRIVEPKSKPLSASLVTELFQILTQKRKEFLAEERKEERKHEEK